MPVIPAIFGSGPPWWLARARRRLVGVELLIARNPDPDSRLPYLLLLPLAGGMVFRTSGTWPRTSAVYCYPVSADEWPDDPDVVERVGVRSCVRPGAAIDLVLDRARENRSQIVFTKARGREAVFWQSPRTRRQARPNVTTPTARAAGIAELEITVDSHERYAYRFGGRQVRTVKRALPCGDYGLVADGRLVASVERKSMADLVASLTGGKLRYGPGRTCGAAPRRGGGRGPLFPGIQAGAVRPALVADGLAELQVRWPNVPVVFCETRHLAEEWTYRFLAAARAWADTEAASAERLTDVAAAAVTTELAQAPGAREPATAEVRASARATGLAIPGRGKLRPEVWAAWRTAHNA
jgi:hypothetical protein